MSQKIWTAADIPDLHEKVIVVTGGNNGLGYESVKAFAEKGANVIMASRSVEKGETARAQIGQTRGAITVMQLDLADFSSIRQFADAFKQKYDRLDVLLNNAGIIITPYFLTKEGLEAQNGTNHFGHFALTGHLLERIANTPGSRVVNVSSMAHRYGRMNFDNLLFENGKGYTPFRAYARSKLANLLFTSELQDRLQENGIDSIAVAAHPGFSKTNVVKQMEDKWWYPFLYPLLGWMVPSAAQGALPQIRASVDPAVKGGEYFGPRRGARGYPIMVQPVTAAHKKDDAKRLWTISEEITGVRF